MGLIKLLWQDPATFILVAVVLLYSIIFHELAHGWVANRMGDPTAKWLGRLTLNPIRHLDLIGTLMLLFVGFGWAKPVPVNYHNLRDQRKGLFLVSSAGIVTNFCLAFIAFLCSRLFPPSSLQYQVVEFIGQINIMLAAFNLIPIPPLDGSKMLMGFLTVPTQQMLSRLEPYGFFIIIILLYTGVLNPLIAFFRWAMLSIIGLFL